MSANTLKSVKTDRPTVGKFDGASTADIISSTHTEELVIALCGPIGSPVHGVGKAIRQTLSSAFGYMNCTYLRLSNFIAEHAATVGVSIPPVGEHARIVAMIDAGNKLREKYGNAILTELAINQIRFDRERHRDDNNSPGYPARRVVHIIDSIKNEDELALLRLVYRDMLYVVGVYAPLPAREANLKDLGLSTPQIYSLIDRDSGEESKAGQTVSNTFPNCDFFLRTGDGTDSELHRRVERFLHLILGSQVITPTSAETAMYAAAMASANSACLSRQVGAAVTDGKGNILSIGWNDVPSFGGGLYSGGAHDHRCYNIAGGKCFNDTEKDCLAREMADALSEVIEPSKLARAKEILRNASKLKGLIEFSRAIHAEMHAILNAGKTAGDRLQGGKLFVTTYPCHSCARHIVAAGIAEVFYIEPYRKSLAIKLHGDAISEHEADKGKVRILAFDGVAPSRYLTLFRVPQNSRKRDGKLITIPLKEASPRLKKSMEALPALEGLVVQALREKQLLTERGTEHDQPPTAPDAAQPEL